MMQNITTPLAITPQTIHPQPTALQRWSRILAGVAAAVTLFVSAPSAQAEDLSLSLGEIQLQQCMAGCADRYAPTFKDEGLRLRQAKPSEPRPVIDDFANRCPDGTTLTPVEMPVYDEQGLFVVGTKIVWFCLPDDLQPAG